MQNRGLVIESVDEKGIAAELGLQSGDTVLEVNGSDIVDIIDYKFLSADENLQVLVHKADGEHWLLEIEKDFDEPLGVVFQNGGIGRTRRCGNKCIFCFVDQMPPRMRPSLYVKDDDYRLSFGQGNFITLTNVSRGELERIAAMRLSPLYISVHATNPKLRQKMMGHPGAGRIMEQLRFLAEAGVEMHTQAVLCPGLNDGEELEQTISDLGGLWPAVRSLAVVPVGLTAHRRGLSHLRPYRTEEARAVIKQVHRRQEDFNSRFGYPLVFAGDEFYLVAEKPIPSTSRYGGFPQIENGVGLVRMFKDQWSRMRRRLPPRVDKPKRYSLVTGTLAGPLLKQVTNELNRIKGLTVKVHVLKNRFFGHNVTVAGLLTGQDILAGLSGKELGRRVFIPAVMLRESEAAFLDDLTLDEISRRLGIPVTAVGGPKDLVREMVR